MNEAVVELTAKDHVTAELERASRLLATAGIMSFAEAMAAITEMMRPSMAEIHRMASAMRQFGRAFRQHRSGHRHRGTRAWALRYAMASSAPLGQRTDAKLQSRS